MCLSTSEKREVENTNMEEDEAIYTKTNADVFFSARPSVPPLPRGG
jgi:hypothetical protein